MNIKTGDFVVESGRHSWRIGAREVAKVTPKLIFYKEDGRERMSRIPIESVVFSGTRAAAVKLAEQLTSSLAQLNDDTSSARLRRKERDQKFIETAIKTAERGEVK
jgi:hypothetical protein